MNGPGSHEAMAITLTSGGTLDQAQVYAILALASAVNRIADVHERAANSLAQMAVR